MKPYLFLAIFSSFLCSASYASSTAKAQLPPTYLQTCFIQAAQHYRVDPYLLYAIAWTESRYNPAAKNINYQTTTSGERKATSFDSNVMQINSFWFKTLRQYNIQPKDVSDNTCLNIHLGAWVLAQNFAQYGYTWKAIGAYNSSNPSIALQYAKRVYQAHYEMTGIPNQVHHIRLNDRDLNTPLWSSVALNDTRR